MSEAAESPRDPELTGWTVTVTLGDGSAWVSARGDLDLKTAGDLETALRQAEAAAGRVTLDLSELTFMDSSGINVLIRHAAHAQRDGFTISIIRPPAHVARVLELAGLSEFLPLVDPSLRDQRS